MNARLRVKWGIMMVISLVAALIAISAVFERPTIIRQEYNLVTGRSENVSYDFSLLTLQGQELNGKMWVEYPDHMWGLGAITLVSLAGAAYACREMVQE